MHIQNIISYLLLTLVLASCGRHESSYAHTTSLLDNSATLVLPTTPVKDQGKTELCWIYALLATLETDHIAMGDSLNLSPLWLARKSLEEQAVDAYFAGGSISLRGTLPEAMRLLQQYGIVSWDAYHAEVNSHTLARKVERLAKTLSAQKTGMEKLNISLADILDDDICPAPRYVFMLGAEYTPLEFAHSICVAGDWQTYTSFTHHPFGSSFAIEVPDNRQRHTAMNIPIDSLLYKVKESLRQHHPVAWEGCLKINDEELIINNSSAQNTRQRLFERHILTDDHCMAIVGMSRNTEGEMVFVCKNSWGTDDGDCGFRYMTERQFVLSTIMVMIKQE